MKFLTLALLIGGCSMQPPTEQELWLIDGHAADFCTEDCAMVPCYKVVTRGDSLELVRMTEKERDIYALGLDSGKVIKNKCKG